MDDLTRLAAEELTRLVQDHTPYPQRAALYAALWDVSLADHKLHDTESRFLDDIAEALAITREDAAAMARHEAGG